MASKIHGVYCGRFTYKAGFPTPHTGMNENDTIPIYNGRIIEKLMTLHPSSSMIQEFPLFMMFT